jgi:stage V sporulation protein AC
MNKEKEQFEQIIKDNPIKRPVIKNSIKAFLIGGGICLFGELIRTILINRFYFDEKTANSIMLIIIIILASLFTGLGIYDKIGQNAGAGSIIPISGFANSLTSSAIESKSEGFVLGILTNVFKLAGAIIVAGIASSFVVATIVYIIRMIYA